jgi:hypothetical protein
MDGDWREATVSIDGVELREAQVRALRVAVSSRRMQLQDSAYRARIGEALRTPMLPGWARSTAS